MEINVSKDTPLSEIKDDNKSINVHIPSASNYSDCVNAD